MFEKQYFQAVSDLGLLGLDPCLALLSLQCKRLVEQRAEQAPLVFPLRRSRFSHGAHFPRMLWCR